MTHGVDELEAARSKAARWKRAVPVFVLCIAGGILIALPGENVPITAVGVFLLGAAAVWLVSLVFLEIGMAEDLDRARTPPPAAQPPRTVPPEDRPPILDP